MTNIATQIALSAHDVEGRHLDLPDFHRWFTGLAERCFTTARRIPLDALDGWHTLPGSGDIVHASGKFFSVNGIDVELPGNAVPRWTQPIINQPEVGILGILVKEFDGRLHLLMQAKPEPGNPNGLQLSPTVQATRSNYTRVHGGQDVPYLEYFRDTSRHTVVADVRQSEQGAWFYQKRNRNMIVSVSEDVELLDGFCWLTLGQVHRLLLLDDLINMDARTVLSCLPFTGAGELSGAGDGFRDVVARSCGPAVPGVHSEDEILRWITDVRTRTEVRTRLIPLHEVRQWHRTEHAITHETGRFFDVMAVEVRASGREVRTWTQPMIEPYGTGLAALLVRRIDGVLHAFVRATAEPGFLDVAELSPTVQCTPENFDVLPEAARPPFLDLALTAPASSIRFDAVLSEEGGRFFHPRTRYVIIEVDEELEHPDFRWVVPHQLVGLLRHSHYVNVQARTLVACLHSLTS
ncbi:NDP-hexose 2,3-dehydratase family protein [Lentzea cavernae]|uniref:NDP-hexose 2,3-dehydratase n=1 Tax=Lentzea cavernae TaxID=2020703 RepID=A0ABQ3MF63_9PSEU|nr:NDP-hexose 2,3-dehydratase family protein [Lentzea cavernae]GHH39501.1 NDP-hexose 2,3-dehydratase [Lentzea cavernae]